jgi:hypothetical protein
MHTSRLICCHKFSRLTVQSLTAAVPWHAHDVLGLCAGVQGKTSRMHLLDRSLRLRYQKLNAWPAKVEAKQPNHVSTRAEQLEGLQ